MTILPYRSQKAAADDASTSLGSSDSSASGGKTDATESISMSYSEDEDDASLCYSDASSTSTPMVPIAIDEGFVVEASADECSVLSLDYPYSSSLIAAPDADSYFLEPSVVAPNASSKSNKEHGENKPRRNLIGQRDLRSFRDSCKKLQHGSPKIQKEKIPKEKVDDAASKPHSQHIPSIGLGPSAFQVTCVMKEGWIYKRGTGGDILGRDGWKRRYAFLVLARNQQISQAIEVPVLLIYRNNSATMPSNIIPLDAAVVMATPGKQAQVEIEIGSSTSFDVLQVKKSRFFSDDVTSETNRSTSTVVASRSFAANKDEADAWVDKINTTLLQFEKRKAGIISVHKKQLADDTKLTQIVAENHWLDIPPESI
mmetsp:Transcript_16056/g.46098  ORF Transcript_16056/g.46098 Transcript_16056/m.46098 type:complete len:370 (-) Transcript_16056:130-1239(-)